MKTAIVTGITGQDGAYLADLLLSRNYKVLGTFRRTSSVNLWRLEELGLRQHPNLELIEYDLTDLGATCRMVERHQPDEIYNLAAQSFVGVSFEQPVTTAQITGLGAVHILEAIRLINKKIKFYQASTSEMFGLVREVPQNESTPFHPRSPYGAAKLYAHWMTVNYREAYGLFATSGILFNHESPLRGKEFVTRKVTNGIARIVRGQTDCIELGNLEARRDWGFAKDYVDGMYRMMQADQPRSYVLATNRTQTVRDFVELAFRCAGIELVWRGERESTQACDRRTGKCYVRINPKFYRPAEVDVLMGDASLAREELKWVPTTSLEELCQSMVDADLRRVDHGFSF